MQQAASYSQWQKKTVPTYTISSARDRGSHSSLQEVIDRMAPFSKLVLQSGTFMESFTISKPIEIVGDGADEPLIITKGPCITIFGDIECCLSGLKVRVRTLVTGSNASRAEPPAILVSNGRPFIEKCEISSLHCGGNSCAVVERCLILGNHTGSGLLLRDLAGGEFRNNEITSHAYYAVEVISRGTPMFALNDIHCRHDDPDCLVGQGLIKVGGLTCDPGDIRPVFENNRVVDFFNESQRATGAVFRNQAAGGASAATSGQEGSDAAAPKKSVSAAEMRHLRTAICIDSASPVFKELVVEHSVIAIALRNRAGGVISESVVTQPILCGIFGERGAQTVLQTTKVLNSGGGGVFLDKCSVLLSGCAINQARGPGVTIVDCLDAGLEQTYVEKCKSGVAVSGRCGGVLSANHIMNNVLYGIRCADNGCGVKLKGNTVLVNGPVGVHITDGANPQLTGNTVAGSQVGVVIEAAATPTAIDNAFSNNEQVNVLFTRNGRGMFSGNTITGGSVASVKVTDGANPVLRGNEIQECSGCGVMVCEGGIGHFADNKIRSHADGVYVALFADPLFEQNEVSSCSRYGAVVDEEGVGTFVANRFHQNHTNIACINGGEAVFRANEISAALHDGGFMGVGSRALLEKNVFSMSGDTNLVLHGEDSSCQVRRNVFRSALGIGLVSEANSGGRVWQNVFVNNKGGGMGTRTGGDAYFEENTSTEDRGPGIVCTDEGRGRFISNTVEGGHSSGCVIASAASPHIEHCTFSGNKAHGIDIREGARGTIKACRATKNHITGLHFSGTCHTKLNDMAIFANHENGIWLTANAVCLVEKCTVHGQKVGLRVSGAGSALVIDCSFRENQIGAVFSAGGTATVRGCSFTNNTEVGIEFREQGSGTVEKCVVERCGVGVASRSRGCGTTLSCTIVNCNTSGVLFDSGGATTVDECEVKGCWFGVRCVKDGDGTVKGTAIHHNRVANICAEAHSRTAFLSNQLHHCTEGFNVECYGDVVLKGNRIERGARGGLYAGTSTHAVIEENEIVYNSQHGVVCGERSEAKLVKNSIASNALSGVKLERVASCVLTENKIHHNGCLGLLCAPRSGGSVHKNEISNNKFANVWLLQQATVQLTANDIVSGNPIGVVIEGSAALLELNTLQQHTHAAVYVVGSSATRLEKNFIFCNTWGVLLEKRGVHELVNELLPAELKDALAQRIGPQQGSRQPGDTDVNATDAAAVTFVTGVDLLFSPTGVTAVSSYSEFGHDQSPSARKESSVTMTGNDFYDNKGCAVKICSGANPLLKGNIFHDDEIGVHCVEGARGRVEGNTFTNNVCGISLVGDYLHTRIVLNKFEENLIGISCSENREHVDGVVVSENRFVDPKQCGVKLALESAIALAHNEFRGGRIGLLCDTGARGSATSNTFADCDVGVHLLSRTCMKISQNHFLSGNEVGVLCSAGGGDVTQNVFTNHLVAGVCVEHQGACGVYRNLFSNNVASDTAAGAMCRNGGSATFYENDFHENSVGVYAHSSGSSDFHDNFIHDNSFGVYCTTGATPTFTRCFLSRNKRADVHSFSGGKPTVTACLFHRTIMAFLIDRRGGGMFTRNIVKECEGAAVSIELDSLAQVKQEVESDRASSVSPATSPSEAALEHSDAGTTAVLESTARRSRSSSGTHLDTTPTFAENYIVDCGAGFAIDCGTPYSRKQRRSTVLGDPQTSTAANSNMLSLTSDGEDMATAGGAVQQLALHSAFPSMSAIFPTRHARAGAQEAGGLEPSASTDAFPGSPLSRLGSNVHGSEGRRQRLNSNEAHSPLPSLMALLRLQYGGCIANNTIVNCQHGVVIRNGPTAAPPMLQDGGAWAEYLLPTVMKDNSLATEVIVEAEKTVDRSFGSSPRLRQQSQSASAAVATLLAAAQAHGSPGSAGTVAAHRRGSAVETDADDVDTFGGYTPIPAVDLCQMVMIEGNTISGCEWGVVVRGGGNARLQRNVIQKSSRGGVLVTDEGRGEFLRNVIKDCASVGILVNSTGGGGGGGSSPVASGPNAATAAALRCFANFEENVVVGARSNVTITCGEPRVFNNVLHGGEIGLSLGEGASGLVERNLVFGNKRVGAVIASELAVLLNNGFYSANEQGAIDVRAESYRLPQGNAVKNQFTPRWNRKDPAEKAKLPSEVTEAKYAQHQTDLFEILRSMHSSQLPQCTYLGCAGIGVENTLLTAVAAMRAAGRMNHQVVVPIVPVSEPTPMTAASSVSQRNNTVRRRTAVGGSTSTANRKAATANVRGGTALSGSVGSGSATGSRLLSISSDRVGQSGSHPTVPTGSPSTASGSARVGGRTPRAPQTRNKKSRWNHRASAVADRTQTAATNGSQTNHRDEAVRAAAASGAAHCEGSSDVRSSGASARAADHAEECPAGGRRSTSSSPLRGSDHGGSDSEEDDDSKVDFLPAIATEFVDNDIGNDDIEYGPTSGVANHSAGNTALQRDGVGSQNQPLGRGARRRKRRSAAAATVLTVGDPTSAAFSERVHGLATAHGAGGPSRGHTPRPPPTPNRSHVSLKVTDLVLDLDLPHGRSSTTLGSSSSPFADSAEASATANHDTLAHLSPATTVNDDGARRPSSVLLLPDIIGGDGSSKDKRILHEIHRHHAVMYDRSGAKQSTRGPHGNRGIRRTPRRRETVYVASSARSGAPPPANVVLDPSFRSPVEPSTTAALGTDADQRDAQAVHCSTARRGISPSRDGIGRGAVKFAPGKEDLWLGAIGAAPPVATAQSQRMDKLMQQAARARALQQQQQQQQSGCREMSSVFVDLVLSSSGMEAGHHSARPPEAPSAGELPTEAVDGVAADEAAAPLCAVTDKKTTLVGPCAAGAAPVRTFSVVAPLEPKRLSRRTTRAQESSTFNSARSGGVAFPPLSQPWMESRRVGHCNSVGEARERRRTFFGNHTSVPPTGEISTSTSKTRGSMVVLPTSDPRVESSEWRELEPRDFEMIAALRLVAPPRTAPPSHAMARTSVGATRLNFVDSGLGRTARHGAVDRFVPWVAIEAARCRSPF